MVEISLSTGRKEILGQSTQAGFLVMPKWLAGVWVRAFSRNSLKNRRLDGICTRVELTCRKLRWNFRSW